MKKLALWVVEGIFITFYTLGTYSLFFLLPGPKITPVLNERWGNIIWRMGSKNEVVFGEYHTYCYYPQASSQPKSLEGEYILKRVTSFTDCQEWFGIVETIEESGFTERQKLEWPDDSPKDILAQN